MAVVTIDNLNQAKVRVYDLNVLINNAKAEITALEEFIKNVYAQANAKNKEEAAKKADSKAGAGKPTDKPKVPEKKPTPVPDKKAK